MKKAALLCVIFLCFHQLSVAQREAPHLLIGGGRSLFGTGDLVGYSFFNEVDLPLTKSLFLSPGLQLSNASRSYQLMNFTLQYITNSVNLYTNINYRILNRSRNHISIGAGPVVRYQNTSIPDGASATLQPSGEYALGLDYTQPTSTLTIGYNVSPSYSYQFSKKFSLGVKLVLQNDTQGDIVTSEMLFLGIDLQSGKQR